MKIIIFILVIASLSLSVNFAQVKEQNTEEQAKVAVQIEEQVPPSIAMATAGLGPFRGYMLAVLWSRVLSLELEQNYSESFMIAQWISYLQPRYINIWKYQATQLSVNMPPLFESVEEKWLRIRQGIDLLKNEGIPKNPKAHQLYDHLGWIYFNKIGTSIDENYKYYSARLAEDMYQVLGKNIINDGYSAERIIENLDKVVQAKFFVPTEEEDKKNYKLLEDELLKYELKLDGKLLRMLNSFEMHGRSIGILLSRNNEGIPEVPGVNNEFCRWLAQKPEIRKMIYEQIFPYLIQEELKKINMDPLVMKNMVEKYGPLDWRHPNVHGLYWAMLGISLIDDVNEEMKRHSVTTVRMEFTYLFGLIRNGRIHYDPWSKTCTMMPEPRFIMPCLRVFDRIREKINDNALRDDRNNIVGMDKFYKAFLGLMDTAVIYSYLYGDEQQSHRYFEMMKDRVLKKKGYLIPELKGSLEAFITARIGSYIDAREENMLQFIDSMVKKGLWDGLARGKVKTFNKYFGLSQYIYEKEKIEHVRKNEAPPSFKETVENACISAFKDNSVDITAKMLVWARLNEGLKAAIYPELAVYFEEIASEKGYDSEKIFLPVQGASQNIPPK